MQGNSGGQLKRAWLDEMISNGVVMQRFLPQHAGGAFTPRPAEPVIAATPSAPAEPAAQGQCSHAGAHPQQFHDTCLPKHASRGWLQGPLRDCAKSGSDDGALARSLLDAGAATEDTDRSGRSALHWAATRGNTSVVIALLDAGADGGARDASGKTPLHCAAVAGHAPVVEALLDRFGCVSPQTLSALHHHQHQHQHSSALFEAAQQQARPALYETTQEQARPALFQAAQQVHPAMCETAHPTMFEAAQQQQAHPTAIIGATEELRRRAAAVAQAEEAEAEAAAASIDEDYLSMVDARNAYGSTALHRAAFKGRERVVLALLRGGAGVGVVAKSGRSALHLACRNAHSGCVEVLLAWGADESARANDGSTPWSELKDAADGRRPGDPNVSRSYFLLNRTQSARAWGRRGWLLMLKATQGRWGVQAEEEEEEEDSDMEAEVVVHHGEGAIALRAGINLAMQEEEEDDDDMGGSGGGFERQEFGGLVRQLVELGGDGCFRLVVSFL